MARSGPGAPDGPGWHVRIVPNRFPITEVHEVVILSPDHERSFGDLKDEEAIEVLTACRDRARAHARNGRASTHVFINHRRAAGASIAHPHAQIVAFDEVPPAILTEIGCTADGCTVCRAMQQDDAKAGTPLVVIDRDVPAWCPSWSTMPYELLIAPRRHRRRFEDLEAEELRSVAATTRDALAVLDHALDDPPYNLLLHSGPSRDEADFHWHIHVNPRVIVPGGFEDGTGMPVNDTPPEEAARQLRQTMESS